MIAHLKNKQIKLLISQAQRTGMLDVTILR